MFTFFLGLPTRRHGRGMGDAATLIGALILIFALQFPIPVTLSPTNTIHVGACLWESSEKVHCQVQSRKVHVLPGVDVHVQLYVARCKKEKAVAVGNIREGAQPGLKQKRCMFRCICCKVLACMCKYALPGARRWERQQDGGRRCAKLEGGEGGGDGGGGGCVEETTFSTLSTHHSSFLKAQGQALHLAPGRGKQRRKNLGSRVALLPEKFLRVRKVFACITEKTLLNCPNASKTIRIF